LGLGLTGSIAEEVGIATEVLGRRERDRIDAVLDRNMAGGPDTWRSDERAI